MNLLDRLERIIELLLAVLFSIMTIALGIQVTARYIFGASLFWAEELARYSMVWLVFLGAVVAVYRNAHTRLDFAIAKLPPRILLFVEVFTLLLCAAFMGTIAYQGYIVLKVAMLSKSTALGLPMGYVYGAILVSGTLMTIYLLNRLCIMLRHRSAADVNKK